MEEVGERGERGDSGEKEGNTGAIKPFELRQLDCILDIVDRVSLLRDGLECLGDLDQIGG